MKTGTAEWSNDSVNIQTGCPYDCLYCYAKEMAIRFHRATPESWAKPVRIGLKACARHKTPGVTMLPTAHDITMDNALMVGKQVDRVLESGNNVLLVTKGRPDALTMVLATTAPTVDLSEFQQRVEVRVTIGSAQNWILKAWEPGAPGLINRIHTLKVVSEAGFKTSLSMEPVLDSNPMAVIEQASPYVTGDIWIGLGKDLVRRVGINNPGKPHALAMVRELQDYWTAHRVHQLYERLKDDSRIRWKDSIRSLLGLGEVAP